MDVPSSGGDKEQAALAQSTKHGQVQLRSTGNSSWTSQPITNTQKHELYESVLLGATEYAGALLHSNSYLIQHPRFLSPPLPISKPSVSCK